MQPTQNSFFEAPRAPEGKPAARRASLNAVRVTVEYPGVRALDDVSISFRGGEIHAIIGENGAGKSTLMKVLSGLHSASKGQLFVGGQEVHFSGPRAARDRGIEMVYQDLALAGNLRIDENIFLGREQLRGGIFINHNANMRKAQEHLDKLKIHVKSVSQRVEELSGGQRQAVAIARATAFDAKVVIMDEPTAALAIKEVRKVLDLIKDLKNHGVSVILISHRMDDIFYVCDRVMALFRGRNFAEAPLTQTDRNEVIGWIMGNKNQTSETSESHDLN